MFGEKLDDTYAAAKERVENPPRLNIYVPNLPTEKKEFAPASNSFTIQKNKDNFCRLEFITSEQLNKLTFEKARNKPLIYCNYPEQIDTKYLKNKLLLLNRVEINKTDDSLLYLSYGKPDKDKYSKLSFIVRVYNPNKVDEDLTVTLKQHGMKTSDNWNLALDVWKDFSNDGGHDKRIRIPYDHSETILKGDFSLWQLEVLARIVVDKKAILAVYICETGAENAIIDYSKAQPRYSTESQLTYSGISPTWQLSTNVKIDVGGILDNRKCENPQPVKREDFEEGDIGLKDFNYAQLRVKQLSDSNIKSQIENSYFYKLCQPRIKNNPKANENESNPIHLIQGGYEGDDDHIARLDRKKWVASINNHYVSDDDQHYANVGNYGVEYNFTFVFSNSNSSPIEIKGYIVSNASSHFAGIRTSNNIEGIFLQPVGNPNKDSTWNFYTATIQPNKPQTIKFTYIHLSKGSAPCLLQWKAELKKDTKKQDIKKKS